MKDARLLKKYRVWYRRPNAKGYVKEAVEVESSSCAEAKKLVEAMIPNSKASSAWLIEK